MNDQRLDDFEYEIEGETSWLSIPSEDFRSMFYEWLAALENWEKEKGPISKHPTPKDYKNAAFSTFKGTSA